MVTRIQSGEPSPQTFPATARPGWWRVLAGWFAVLKRTDAGISKPRGLLPTPPEIAERVTRELRASGVPVTDGDRQRITDVYNLQYYFRGEPVALRRTDRGVEVLAVGADEVDDLFRKLSAEDRQGIIVEHPGP